MSQDARLELTLVTGFLGSGKTTLLRRRSMGRRQSIAVVVNEFADAGVDHDVLAPYCASAFAIVGGCACCERLEDLLAALRSILDEHERGGLKSLSEVAIETSGLADPLPIVSAVMSDPVLRHHFKLRSVIAVVDGLEGARQLARHPEARRQVAAADEVVISKTDLASADQVKQLQSRIDSLASVPEPHDHTASLRSVSIAINEPLDWVAFGVWLTLLVHAHGQRLLRIKGIVPAEGIGAVALNSVQSSIFRPEHIGSPGADTRLVVISDDLDGEAIRRSLYAFQRAA